MADGRRILGSNDFLEEFGRCLRRASIDVTRITTGVPILHPQIFSFSGLWELGKGVSERLYRADPSLTASNTPILIAYGGGEPVRCDLTAPPQADEFAILAELRRDGYTDYIVYALPFADGSFKALSVATQRSGGFAGEDVALF